MGLKSKIDELKKNIVKKDTNLPKGKYLLATASDAYRNGKAKANDLILSKRLTLIKKLNDGSLLKKDSKGMLYVIDEDNQLAYSAGKQNEDKMMFFDDFKNSRIYNVMMNYKENFLEVKSKVLEDIENIFNIEIPTKYTRLYEEFIILDGGLIAGVTPKGKWILYKGFSLVFEPKNKDKFKGFKNLVGCIVTKDTKISYGKIEYCKKDEELAESIKEAISGEIIKLDIPNEDELRHTADIDNPKIELNFIYYDKDNSNFVSTNTRVMTIVDANEAGFDYNEEFYIPNIGYNRRDDKFVGVLKNDKTISYFFKNGDIVVSLRKIEELSFKYPGYKRIVRKYYDNNLIFDGIIIIDKKCREKNCTVELGENKKDLNIYKDGKKIGSISVINIELGEITLIDKMMFNMSFIPDNLLNEKIKILANSTIEPIQFRKNNMEIVLMPIVN